MFNLSCLEFTPYVGAGIGFSNNEMNNFYTVGSTNVAGEAVGSVSSIAESHSKNSFSWQGTVAVNVRPDNSHFSANLGYRYFDGGNFNSAASLFTNSDGIVSTTQWSGDVIANQMFVEFKYTV